MGSPAALTMPALKKLRTNVVSANAASPRGAGSAIDIAALVGGAVVSLAGSRSKRPSGRLTADASMILLLRAGRLRLGVSPRPRASPGPRSTTNQAPVSATAPRPAHGRRPARRAAYRAGARRARRRARPGHAPAARRARA